MNTFLPFPSFTLSASCLDKRRCLKQVVEAYQILNVLDGKSDRWKNHPAVRMWRGYRDAIQLYYNTFYWYCEDIHRIKFNKLPKPCVPYPDANGIYSYIKYPQWLGYPPFHLAMTQNLIRKACEDNNKVVGLSNLTVALYKAGVNCDLGVRSGYLWPVDKNGELLPEIKEWINGSKTR